MSAPGDGERPVLRVVRGDASPEEIAALVAVLTAAGREAVQDNPTPTRSAWSDRSRLLRRPLYSPVYRGPGAWRRSALP